MNQEILCTWLDVPKSAWPPDPWALLGLSRGEHDMPTLEERVHARMTKLRHYQLSYPEEATEGMNRLAEAFITLTQTCVQKPAPCVTPAQAAASAETISKDETSIVSRTKVDWRDEPPPVRQETPSSPEVISNPELILEDEAAAGEVLVAKPFVAPTKSRLSLPGAVVQELAEESDEATSNLATIEAVIERVEATRRLLHAWDKFGKAIHLMPKKTSARENEQFAKRLQTIADSMKTYPAFLGHPGKPGYRVVVQSNFKISLATMRAMTPDQRDALLVDWQDGRQVLLAHRKYLHKLFKSMRHRSSVGLALHAARSFLNDHPRWTLAGMIVVVVLALVGGTMLALK